jgi:hypothetical protein
MPVCYISLEISQDAEKLTVKAQTENISKLDVFIDDRRNLSIDVIHISAQFVLKKAQYKPSLMKIEGFNDKNVVAVHRAEI